MLAQGKQSTDASTWVPVQWEHQIGDNRRQHTVLYIQKSFDCLCCHSYHDNWSIQPKLSLPA